MLLAPLSRGCAPRCAQGLWCKATLWSGSGLSSCERKLSTVDRQSLANLESSTAGLTTCDLAT